MEAILKRVYAGYSQDDRGYTVGKPITGYYVISSAADAALAALITDRNRGYASVVAHDVITFEDTNYVFKNRYQDISKLIDGAKMCLYTPQLMYKIENEQYCKPNESKYYSSISKLATSLKINSIVHLKTIYLITDGKSYWELEDNQPIKIEKFIETREIAIAHALSKLTTEEKKLLGLL